MDIQKYIDEYIEWLKREITFQELGEYYEITTPFIDSIGDCLQIYVKMDRDNIIFSDDGAIINGLAMGGFVMTKNRKAQITQILSQFGVQLHDDELTLTAPAGEFAQRKHSFLQCMLRINDMYLTSRARTASFFIDDINGYFNAHDIFPLENAQFMGKSGFYHNYDFALPRSRNKPERLCLAVNQPSKTTVSNTIFAWNDTKEERRRDSQLIVFLNDENKKINSAKHAFSKYDIKTILWSEREEKKNLALLSA